MKMGVVPNRVKKFASWFGEGRNREGVPHRPDDVRDREKGDLAALARPCLFWASYLLVHTR